MRKFKGSIKVSGDKSISHRALILSSMAVGKTKISNLLESQDVMSTIKVLRELGIIIRKNTKDWFVYGNGTGGFCQPKKELDCGNSGTTARLLIGAVSSNQINCTFVGDKSLSKRPMSRITNYLRNMGANVNLTNKNYLPLMIYGDGNLLPMQHVMDKASAQVKSGLMLAALNTFGKTKIIEPRQTRDHTERLMKFLNLKLKVNKLKKGETIIELNGPYEIKSKNISVVGDPSSASFFLVGALITPSSKIKIKDVSLNKTRIVFVDILKKMGGKIKIEKKGEVCGEKIGNITAEYSQLKGINIESSLSPLLIDEYPIISIAASQAKGKTIMNGISELRYKESDRAKSIISNFKNLGINTILKKDKITIFGKALTLKKSKKIKSYGDHRIAMSFAILNVLYENKLKIDDTECISISYPKFYNHLKMLTEKKV